MRKATDPKAVGGESTKTRKAPDPPARQSTFNERQTNGAAVTTTTTQKEQPSSRTRFSRSTVIKVLVFLSIPPVMYNFVEISEFSGNLFESFGVKKSAEARELEGGHTVVKVTDSHHGVLLTKVSHELDEWDLPQEQEKEMMENLIAKLKQHGGKNVTKHKTTTAKQHNQKKATDVVETEQVSTKTQPAAATSKTPNPTDASATPKLTPNPTEAPKTPSPTETELPRPKIDIPDNTNFPLIPVIDYNYEHDFVQYRDHRNRFALPEWLDEFLKTQPANNPQAHHEMLTNPDNKFIVITCYKHSNNKLEDCGGFSDRLALMPYQLWLAHKTGRKFLIKYYKPLPLEEFLVPPPDGFDWRLPDGYLMDEWYEYGNRTANQYKGERRVAWHTRIEEDKWKDKKVIFMNSNLAIPAVQPRQDELVGTPADDLWPALFRRLFQPSPGVAKSLSPLTKKLKAGMYAVAHVRAKWPNPAFGRLNYKNQKWWKADKEGGELDMEDTNTSRIISTLANHAVECAVRVMPETEYVYLASDSSELVVYLQTKSPYWSSTGEISKMSWPGADPTMANSTKATEHGWGVPAWEIPTTAKTVARPDFEKAAPHFDGAKWDRPEGGYPVFEDMWMMAHAKCHTTGVGGFGRLGSVLSGNRKICASRHRDYSEMAWSCPTPDERKAFKAIHPGIKRRRRRRRN
ncbi:expressed unknown protein [Seminavis robusta]|uniref:Uncharacterized protein n=1 Tax=Seminavis robusta TaxID=568900 RepID=A0A9N8EX27_9STRA|nr:expressed unknown protein [Seminavis robusta]|eukprot:Sro2332_g323650.1 n/a (687) ;mRNA; r:11720-13780